MTVPSAGTGGGTTRRSDEPLGQHREWMDRCTWVFLDHLSGLVDEELQAPTLLPGWSRAHLVAHLHHNAEALLRLVRWARTGERTPMYESPQQRAAEIEATSSRPAPKLRSLVHESACALAENLDAVADHEWDHLVENAQGGTIPVAQVPWMRAREVAVHAVDLAAGCTFEHLPGDFTAALVHDVVARRLGSGEAPVLAAWLTGRSSGAPRLGPWL